MSTTAPDGSTRATRLRVSEIFHSIQGESSSIGQPTVFVRLTGCPLRCSWCDTAYAFSGGELRSLEDILAAVAAFGAHHVCVTGGEPLAQKGCLALLTALCDAGYSVSLETSGALDIAGVDPRVSRIVDLKAPGSGEEARNLPQVKVGDRVVVTYYEALAVNLTKDTTGGIATRKDTVTTDRAELGQKPAGMVRQDVEMVANVTGINKKTRRVTLQGAKSAVTLKVPDDIDISKLKVGDQVKANYTQELAVAVEPAAAKKK